MITVDLGTWVSIASLLAATLAIIGTFARQVGGLKADIAGVDARLDKARTELKSDIAGLRSEMKTEFGRVESRLNGLEQRTSELSTRLPPLPTRAE